MFAASMGGHYKELMGLKSLFPKYDSVLVTDNKAAKSQTDILADFKIIELATAMSDWRESQLGIVTKNYRWTELKSYIKLFRQGFNLIVKYKPKVIISTGSHIAVPLFWFGKMFGAKLIFIESNAMVYSQTITGKLVRKISDKIFVQWPEMKKVYPEAEYSGVLN